MYNRHQKSPSLFSNLSDMLNQQHPLYLLAGEIDWNMLEKSFSPLYSQGNGRPCKPIRLMCGLLILKHLRNLSDESVVEQWSENAYYQYFCGMQEFSPGFPCNATELVHFRKRIGEKGMELILQESIRVNNKDNSDAHHDTAFIDSTVQEKNVTYPTDAKLHKKIVKHVLKIVHDHNLPLRQSYTFVLKKIYRDQRFRNLSQKRTSPNKIYSIHEPQVLCISKGKEHKKYEFGNKVSVIRSNSGIILGAMSFRNEYDGHTIAKALEQVERLTGKCIKKLAGDRGYRGRKEVNGTQILIPDVPKKSDSRYQKSKKHKLFCKRAGIEPTIGHLKSDYRLGRNFYKGVVGDSINILLAAAAYNFKRAMKVLLAPILDTLKKMIEMLFCNSISMKYTF